MMQTLNVFDFDLWQEKMTSLKADFLSATPFPHIVLDNFLDTDLATHLSESFPDPTSDFWLHYDHVNEKLMASAEIKLLDSHFKNFFNTLNSDRFSQFISKLTNIENLFGDPALEGGGLIYTPQNGHLNIHSDFSMHPHQKNWRRRVNLLLYLNSNWSEDYGGYLEFWDQTMTRPVKKIAPSFNRAIIFSTTETSFHGYPEMLKCPSHMGRKSLGLYYYSQETKPLIKATRYQPRPEDSFLKQTSIKIENKLISAYNSLKNTLGIDDKLGCSLLRLLPKNRHQSEKCSKK